MLEKQVIAMVVYRIRMSRYVCYTELQVMMWMLVLSDNKK